MTSAKPLKEAFTQWPNARRVLISCSARRRARSGLVHRSVLRAVLSAERFLKVHATSANYIVAIALVLGMPFFVVFGALSDRLGRKEESCGRLPAGGDLLHADLSGHAGRGQAPTSWRPSPQRNALTGAHFADGR